VKKVSVIVPCYNSVKYLHECLNSIEKQTIGMENLEVILVNDASTDATWDIILEFEKRYSNSVIAIDMQENRRQGGARNEGLKYATGEYIAFLDSDDIVLPEAYERIYHCAVANDADIVQFNHYNFTNNQMQLCDNCRIEGIIDLSKVEVRKLFLSAEIMTLGCWNKLYRRSMVAESGAQYAEHRIYEEPAFVYPQMFCARRVYTMREAYYKIRMHTASTLHSEAKKAERLLDYSEVQMQLMKYLLTQRDFMVTYREKIELYFLRSYYIEQLYLAGKAKQVLDLTYFNKMQNTVKELFPEWRANSYLQDKNMQGLVSILETFETELDQEELSALCVRVAQM